MPLTFASTQAGSSTDYIKYLTEQPVKTDRYMDSDLLDFKLYAGDSSFVRLNRGAYVTLNTATYGTWFSGYIISDPTLNYLGVSPDGKPNWEYQYQATADDYILNLQPLGYLPNYLNLYMGDIIKSLVKILAPGIFDVSNISNGQFTAQYSVTPQSKFIDVIKDLCQASSCVFYAKNHKLYFVKQDSLPISLTVDCNGEHFTPSQLTLKPSSAVVINQAVVLGELEPQTYVNSYFVGDGFTGSFPLITDVFGVDRFTLIQEAFTGSSVDSNTWNIYDPAGTNLQLYNGYLNCIGGTGGSAYDTNLQSLYPIPLEGNIRFTHGEWDFLEPATTSTSFGVICGVWTNQSPTSSFSGCLYGLLDHYDGLGAHVLSPIVNGSMDSLQSAPIDNTKRYVIRTLASFGNINRVKNVYTYTSNIGVINNVTLPVAPDLVSWQTTIIEIDPLTGRVTNTTMFSNIDNTLSSSQLYGTYIPVASSSLRVTVTGITVSVPLQAYLEQEAVGESGYTSKLIGPNEIDSLDNTAPVATIVQGNVNVNSRSSFTGKPNYIAGQASLVYFKDSTTLQSTTPPLGTSIHLAYRGAGYALGKANDNVSILTESQSWGDSGIRTSVKTDMTPRPRTSEECEAAAASIVGDNSYQHYEGTYNVFSTYTDSEPIAGSILKFTNVPTTLPTIKAEEINQVVSTMVSSKNGELFTHQISFGKPDYVRKLVNNFYQPSGIFLPTDAATTPYAVDASAVGTTFAPDVVAPTFAGYDTDQYYYDCNQMPPVGGGFEVRYTDDSWGVDDGKNLITRFQGYGFQVPRSSRSKVVYIKGYDVRNKLLNSEDYTQSPWSSSGASVSSVLDINPNGHTSHISNIVFGANGYVSQSAGSGVFSVSLKGVIGGSLRISLGSNSVDVKLTGSWQRVSVTGSGAAKILSLTSQTAQSTFASLETGSVETQYCKTKSASWGAYSRFASAVHVAYPLVPNPPTAVVDTSDPGAVVISLIPPILAADVWGMELRSAPGYGSAASLGTPVFSSGGAITSIPVLQGGKNYTYPPNVDVHCVGGQGIFATSSITNGVVTAINITNGGTGYTLEGTTVKLVPAKYNILLSQDIFSNPPPYTYTDTSPVDITQYFPFTYNLLKEYSDPGILEGEQAIPLNIVPVPAKSELHPFNYVDALYGNVQTNYYPSSLKATISYTASSADSNVLPVLTIVGNVPVTTYINSETAPIIDDLVVEVDNTNGRLIGGHTYYVCVCGSDVNGAFTPVSKMLSVYIPGAMINCKIVIPKITIPDPSAMTTMNVFVAMDNPQSLALTSTAALPTIIVPNPSGNPAVVTSVTSAVVLTMPYAPNTVAAPALAMDKVRVKAKQVIHSGCVGGTVTSVSSNTVVVSDLIDTSSTPDNWTGYILSAITNPNGRNVSFNFFITAFDAATGTFTTSSSGIDPNTLLTDGFIIVVRANATTFSSTTIGCSGFLNVEDDHVGLTPDAEIGYLVRIIAGTGAKQIRKIVGNTPSVYTVSPSFDTIPDETSVFIVEGYDWQYTADSISGLMNADKFGSVSLDMPLDNLKNTTLLIMMQTVTKAGVESPEYISPIAELYMSGNPGVSSSNPGYTTVTPDADGNVVIDLANGFNQRLVLTSGKPVAVNNPGFETGDLTGWTSTSSSANAAVNTNSRTGSWCLQQTAPTLESQAVTGLTTAKRYTVSAWVRSEDSASTAIPKLSVHDGTTGMGGLVFVEGVAGFLGWQKLRVTYICTSANALTINLEFKSGGSGLVDWDDITVDLNRPLIKKPIWTGGTITQDIQVLTLYEDQDSVGGWLSSLFETGVDAFAIDTENQTVEDTPNTRTTFVFQKHPTVWGLDITPRTGGAIT